MAAPTVNAVEPGALDDPKHSPVTFDRKFNAQSLLSSARYRMLARRESYAECTQHHHKLADFDGNIRQPGPPTGVPTFAAAPAPFYVPLANRYPRAQYPLAKLINRAFSALIFGEGRCPELKYSGDKDATDYVSAIAVACDFWTKMHLARNWGGGAGTVGLSWCFHEGLPRVEVHRAKHLWVHEWADRQELVPAAVSEVYTYPYEEWDEKKKRFVENWYWYHRYWDQTRDILFESRPVRDEQGRVVEPDWVPEEFEEHNDGEAHFVWIQNVPTDEIDGLPDYDGQQDDLDDLDVVYSVLTRGTTLNLDPTLVLKQDPQKKVSPRGPTGVSKGSDNALTVGESGDAKYLELAGTSVTAGLALLDAKKKAILEVAQCILADPNQVAAAGISSVALKIIYAPMLSVGNVYRSTYGKGGKRVLSAMMRVARDREDEEVLELPPRVKEEKDEETGEITETLEERKPGESENLELKWPAYFQPTAADQTAAITTLSTATGAKQIISTRTANAEAAKAFGVDPAEEWDRLQDEQDSDHQTAADAFTDADAGGRSTEMQKDLPGGGHLKISSKGEGDKPPPPPPPVVAPGGGAGAPGGPGAPGGGGAPPGAAGAKPGAPPGVPRAGGTDAQPKIGPLPKPKLPKG
jgi:hypothetical protein